MKTTKLKGKQKDILGNPYVNKIKKKIQTIERTIYSTETTIEQENAKRQQAWTSTNFTEDTSTQPKDGTPILNSQNFTIHAKNALIESYLKLADLKRMEAGGLEQHANWLKETNTFSIRTS